MPWWNQVARVDRSELVSHAAQALSPASGASLHPRQFVAPLVVHRQAETVHHVQPPLAPWIKGMDEDGGIRLHQGLHGELVTVEFDWA